MTSSILDYFKNEQTASMMVVLVDKRVMSNEIICLHGEDFTLLLGSAKQMQAFLHLEKLTPVFAYLMANGSKVPLLMDVSEHVRIEPGSVIRQGVQLADGSIVLMGAIINVGACIGEDTMIDMNAVIGAGAQIGKHVHIGAGAVIAGMLEPACEEAVVIADDVLIGANAVILEGIHIGRGAIIGAGSIVTHDVEAGTVVQGVPARVVKMRSEVVQNTELNNHLR